MKFNRVNTAISIVAVATVSNGFGSIQAASAASIQLIGLADNNTLVLFNPSNCNTTRTVGITGITGIKDF